MTTDTLEVQATLLAASVDDRTVKYRILPYGVQGATSRGRVTASKGCLTLPDDVSSLALNDRHIGDRVLAACTAITEDDAGLIASFHVHDGQAGDDLLDEVTRARSGSHPGVELRASASVEVKNPVIRAGRLLAGVLDAVAAVVRPAFAGSTLLAADAGELPEGFPEYLSPNDSTSESTEELVIDGVTYIVKRKSTSTTTVEAKSSGEPPAAQTPPDAANEGETVTASLTASAPTGMQAVPGATTTARPTIQTPRAMAQLLAAYCSNRSSELLDLIRSPEVDGGDLFAALSDIKWDGTGGLSQTITQPQWIGNVWAGRRFQRRYIPLMLQDTLTSLSLKGWTWGTKPVMAAWSGNKSAVPSGTVTATPVTGTAQRYAGAHDIAREFRDFSSAEFWEAYFQAMTDSYAQNTDEAALATLLAGATDVVPGTVPTDVPDALAYIVDGVLAMPRDATASYAIVAPDLWRELVLTPTDKALEFLSASLNLEDAEGVFDRFKIVAAHTDDDFPDGSVLVGAREASTSQELPGSPIRVEAENIANGGIDEGMFGYHGVTINNAAALALVAPVTP